MNTAYEAQIRGALQQPAPKATLTSGYSSGFPTVGFLGTSSGILSMIAPYLIYALLITFVIMLILTVIHYTVKPIFNFGQNPDALINLSNPDYVKSWQDPTKSYVDSPAGLVLPKNNYSCIFDVYLTSMTPAPEVGNIYVILYKTAGILQVEGQTPASNMITEVVETDDKRKFAGDLITNFDFLNTPQTPTDATKPSLVVAYDALAGKLVVYFIVTDGNTQYLKTVSSPISPLEKYRVSIVVTNTFVELYLNGKYATSKIYPGQTIHGTDNDILVSTPSKFGSRVKVANMFLTNRVISSGEVRTMGGPADMKV